MDKNPNNRYLDIVYVLWLVWVVSVYALLVIIPKIQGKI